MDVMKLQISKRAMLGPMINIYGLLLVNLDGDKLGPLYWYSISNWMVGTYTLWFGNILGISLDIRDIMDLWHLNITDKKCFSWSWKMKTVWNIYLVYDFLLVTYDLYFDTVIGAMIFLQLGTSDLMSLWDQWNNWA